MDIIFMFGFCKYIFHKPLQKYTETFLFSGKLHKFANKDK